MDFTDNLSIDIQKERSEVGEREKDPLRIHKAQLITYTKLAEAAVGLLIYSNVKPLKNGIRRLISPRLAALAVLYVN